MLPWFESGWQSVAGGAFPSRIDLDVIIGTFPSPGLQTGKTYQVRIWVQNGAGQIAQTAPVTIQVVSRINPPAEKKDSKVQTGAQSKKL